MSSIIKNDKKTIRAWTFYDWANSSFPLVINSAIFPAFYEYQTTVRDEQGQIINDTVNVLGHTFKNTELYSYFVSLALLVVCFTAPILSGIADYRGNKKRFLAQFCILGSFSCAGLFFFDKNHMILSMIPFLTATIGYWGSLVFYNAYLPEIATVDMQDKVSAKGFALGYIGSSILLIINLVLITLGSKAKEAGGENFYPAKYAFITVAIWWFCFALYTLRNLPKGIGNGSGEKQKNVLSKGFKELLKVFRELKDQTALKRFLRSYFFYNMGVQTVMYMATLFAAKEIDWPSEDYKKTALIVSILLIQFLGVAGSFLFSWVSSKIGNVKALGIAIFIWILICVSVFLFINTPVEFYCVAASVGLVMGGIQALSRSTYSKLLPETKDHASYFSFFDVTEKIGIVVGTFSFGLIEGLTGSMRQSVLALISFFAIGFILLLFIPKKKSIA
ncbi:MAG: MFS transporter [Bacteroidota bacterium]|nr:MFS transporter [Bacteroidota bacterium]